MYIYVIIYNFVFSIGKGVKIPSTSISMASDFFLTSTTAVGAAAVAAPPPAVGAVAVAGGASGASNFKFVALGPSWMLPSQDVYPNKKK